MSIKLAILKSGETIIADIKELVSDEKKCGYVFEDPQIISIKREMLLVENEEDPNVNRGEIQVSLSPWIVLTAEKQILISPDYIVTIVDPVESVKQMYEEKVNV
jgi:hypothetical protein